MSEQSNAIESTIMISPAVAALINRMKTNPKEFWGDSPRWRFIFSGNTKELLTEPEKAAIHTTLMEVRRMEFQHLVLQAIMEANEDEEKEKQVRRYENQMRIRGAKNTVKYDPQHSFDVHAFDKPGI